MFVLKQGNMVARFAPHAGANVFSIQVAGIEYLRTPADMYRFDGWQHGTPVLYPTPNRVRDATFRFKGKSFAMQPNFGANRIHGLVIAEPWRVVGHEATEDSAVIRSEIRFSPGTELYRQFPFSHRLLLTVTVTDGAVRWDYEVDNHEGRSEVPYGFGLHPYFIYQGVREETCLTLPATHWMEAHELLPTGRLVPAAELKYDLSQSLCLNERNFDDVFWGLRAEQPSRVEFRDRERGIQFATSPEFRHLVVWAQDIPVFSIENQTSSTDAHNLHAAGFEDAAQLQLCPPGERCRGWVEFRFSGAGGYEWVWEDPDFLRSQEHCESCHGIVFSGARAPELFTGYRHAQTIEDVVRIIREGLPATEMPAFAGTLSDAEIDGLAGFMNRIHKDMPIQELEAAREILFGEPRQSFEETFALKSVVEGLGTPWSFAFLPDGSILLTEKEGRLRRVENGEAGDPIQGIPAVTFRQDAGLLALALHPGYAQNGWIYLAFSDPGANPDASTTKVVRGRIRGQAWVDQQTIWSAAPELYRTDNSHFGTRLLFDGDYLFFSIGDRGRREDAQDLGSPYGKIHRLHADGSVPEDNPFADTEGALATVWSYGHRNVQGLARSPTGELWASEHGPRGGDELNRIVPGGNYGWPLVTHGLEFNGERISDSASRPGMIDPELVWPETLAPAAIGFYTGDRFPHWRGHLLVTSLAAKELRLIAIDNGKVHGQELLLQGIGRIRDVQLGPDGSPYIAVEGLGRILRLVPATRTDTPLF